MPSLRVQLFGRLVIVGADGKHIAVESAKAQELLCYLLVNHKQPHHREVLADLLFRNEAANSCKSYLRKALWQLQTAFAREPETEGSGLLLVEPDWIQFNPAAGVWVDLHEFEAAYELAKRLDRQAMEPEQILAMERAVELYRGNLLEGSYAEWCLFERERLQFLYLALLDRLIDNSIGCHRFEDGIRFALQALAYDSTREHTHRRLMQLHYWAGNRASALRQYERCVAVLAAELGVPPSAATVKLYNQILGDELLPMESPAPLADPAQRDVLALTLGRLASHASMLHGELIMLLALLKKDLLSN